jgi:hypothetical protein
MRSCCRLLAGIGLLIITIVLGGCASVPMGNPAQDTQAKKFTPPTDKAAIYVYRTGSFGGAYAIPVAFDGQIMGKTAVDTYFYWLVKPGRYAIATGGETASQLEVTVEAGKNYFIWQNLMLGALLPRSTLVPVDEQAGRAAVRRCGLIASLQPKDTDQDNLNDLKGLLQPSPTKN